jgi:hypothetical protein
MRGLKFVRVRMTGTSVRKWAVGAAVLNLAVLGCNAPKPVPPGQALRSDNERHIARFGDFELPRKLGTVENAGLQLPVISPDGRRMLYLRTDRPALSPWTLIGSADPQHTPAEGMLALWMRPTEGNSPGEQVSNHRWCHSPVWSDSGQAVAYVVNEAPGSFIIHRNMVSGQEVQLGVPEAVNCMPRFDRDDQTVLFCSGPKAEGPFRIWRQFADGSEPVALTPEGMDCVLPLMADAGGTVVCGCLESGHLTWVRCGRQGSVVLAAQGAISDRSQLLQTWAGIPSPLSPDRRSFLFYDSMQNRIVSCQPTDRGIVRHRQNSIAACWLSDEAVALATSDWVFVVNVSTGLSPQLLNGAWVPCRYLPATNRLLMLGAERRGRFSIVDVVFKPKAPITAGERHSP